MEDDISSKSSLSGFAYYLSESKLLDNKIALDALQEANLSKIPYIEYLIKQKLLTVSAVAKATSEYFGLPLCDVSAINLDLVSDELLNIPLVRKRLALPLFTKDNFLYLAVTDPTSENLYDVRFLTGFDIRLLIAEGQQLTQAIDNLLNRVIMSEISGSTNGHTDTINVNPFVEETTDLAAYDAESAPVVNYVNKIIVDAIEKGASDIHFERYESEYRIRYRINGILYPIANPPIKLANFLLARIKIMASLDITEHRVPQDGRFKLALSRTKTDDFRVSVCPTLYGEKVVLRILDLSTVFQSLDDLGMDGTQKDHLTRALSQTQGMILVTGPTGSGKTVTLYSALSNLNTSDCNIMTVEDPVEIPMYGINQVHVNSKVGLTFSSVLRSFLRQDPDIIMVGEVRDLETAEISIKAAQTGHLVLSTLHTNNAPETVTRLMNMGIAPYNVASSLILVIAQRLIRELCDYCKLKEELPEDLLLKEGFNKDEIGKFQLYKPSSCEHCMHGYRGRTGIFEVMPITETMTDLIMHAANALELTAQARNEGVISLRQSGLSKVKQGITSLKELNSVFN